MHQVKQTAFSKEKLLNNYWGHVQETIKRFGDKEFIVTKNGSVTYKETNHRANVIFHAIQGLIGERGVGIGLFMKDPRQIIPAMMGVLKSRNYFIPLDVGFPESALHYMFTNAGIKVILTVDQQADQIRSLAPENLRIINIDDLTYESEIADPVVSYAPEEIVQILFTSGSTGQPKGAIEDYRYLIRSAFIKVLPGIYKPEDRFLQLSTFTYSATHGTVFSALLNGITTCYYNLKEDGLAGLPEWIRQQHITIYNSTPTVFRSLVSILDSTDTFPYVRIFRVGGEKNLGKDIQAIKKHFPGVERIRLGFAATETEAIASTLYPVDFNFEQDNLPCGKPYEDLKVFIWDEAGNPLPIGEEGEIVVYGNALARGYINNSKLTKERFIPDPNRPGWQYFKTGDMGKLLLDGQLVHLGRLDHMVKIKGVRIELDSIESHMLSYPGIIQVASRTFEDQRGNIKLVSYYEAEKGIEIPISDLRKHLAERLPLHLLPHYLVGLAELPLTGTGKVAINQLPLPQTVRPELSNAYIGPVGDLEQKLVEIWEEQLGIQGIGVTDDFFDVGGDSLLGVLLFVRVEEVLGRKLPVTVLLKASTIRKLAEVIQAEDTSRDFSPIIPVNTVGEHPPLFFIPGKGGYPTRIRHLARNLDPQTPIYALQDLSKRSSSKRKIPWTIESVASYYLSEIKKIYPRNPYILVGESLGGKIAYEMAQQELSAGEIPPVLALLDTYNFEDSVIEFYKSKKNIPYYKMLIKKHLSILFRSNWQGKLDYLRFYRTTFRQKARRFLRRRIRNIKKSAITALPKNERQIEKANRQASQAYEVKSYSGRVILFKALRGPKANDPTNGWDQVALGELIIHPLDCYHGSILFDPAVRRLAEILQIYIEKNTLENA
jgi:amino acid adenylation domain-containing protein